MQKHTKNYYRHFGFQDCDFVSCEHCGAKAVDIHHIFPRSYFGSKTKDQQDDVKNLIALCRTCHEEAHANILDRQYLTIIHNAKLNEV